MNYRGGALVLASLSTHALVAAGVSAIPVRETHAATSITLREPKRARSDPPKPRPEPPPPQKAEDTSHRVKSSQTKSALKATESTKSHASAPGSGDLLDLGLLPGGDGPGLGVGASGPGEAAPPNPVKSTEPVKQARVTPASTECDEPLQKPTVDSLPQPVYSQRARESAVQGKVRVTIQVDERGAVAGVSILSGLGFGLDEAALEAARRAKFKPATRCGKPVAASFVVAMRFAL